MSTAILTGALTALNFVGAVVQRVFKAKKTDSLVSFTKSTRVEPIVMIDRRLAHTQELPDIMQSLLSLFSAYYLQAIALLTHVESINVIKVLDTLNPQRDMVDASDAIVNYISRKQGMMSTESYTITLPRLDGHVTPHQEFVERNMLSFESAFTPPQSVADVNKMVTDVADNIKDKTGRFGSSHLDEVAKAGGVASVTDGIKALNEATNLSVGKMLQVKIGSKENSAVFPIMVRMIATYLDTPVLTHILGDGSRNITMKERYHAWRSKDLEFWRDLVLCTDLIDEHKKALVQDKSGTYDEILERRMKNSISAHLTDTPSIGTASNLLVVSKQTIKELEREIGGSIDNYEVRQKVFKSTYVMIMAVVETERWVVTFYHRNIKLASRLSIAEMKTSNKGSGPDIGDLLKAFMLGNAPAL